MMNKGGALSGASPSFVFLCLFFYLYPQAARPRPAI